MRSKQRGVSFLGLIFVGGTIACVGIIAAQVVPTAVEYQAITKAVKKASMEGNTVAEIRTIFEKITPIDDIKSVKPGDLDMTKQGDKVVVSFAYTKVIHLAGPGYLLLKYNGSSSK